MWVSVVLEILAVEMSLLWWELFSVTRTAINQNNLFINYIYSEISTTQMLINSYWGRRKICIDMHLFDLNSWPIAAMLQTSSMINHGGDGRACGRCRVLRWRGSFSIETSSCWIISHVPQDIRGPHASMLFIVGVSETIQQDLTQPPSVRPG